MKAFCQASQHIVQQFGQPVVLTLSDGNEQMICGVFDRPDGEMLIQSKRGGLALKSEQTTLTVVTCDCPPLDTVTRIRVGDVSYYPLHHKTFRDDFGCTVIVLAVATKGVNSDEKSGVWR